MNAATVLERRYRRLLAWYPAAHRSTHGEEMIGVLMASADEGQRRPGPSDALDLILGGMLIRLRSIRDWSPGQAIRDALAVFSICMPVIWIISITVVLCVEAATTARFGLRIRLIILGYGVVEAVLVALPVVLGWRGRPRTGIALAVLPAALTGFLALNSVYSPGASHLASLSLLFAGEAAALAASPGPRRGAALMSRPCWAVTVGTGLAIALWQALPWFASELAPASFAGQRIEFAIPVAIAVAAGFLLTLPRPVARRLLLLFAGPAWLGLIGIVAWQAGRVTTVSLFVLYLPALALATITIAAGLRPQRWRRPGARATGS